MDESLHALTQRLDRLEKAQRRWRTLATVVLVLLAGSVLVGQAPAAKLPVIEAREFVLRDDHGRVRARLGFNRFAQYPELVLYDAKTQPRVSLAVSFDRIAEISALSGGAVAKLEAADTGWAGAELREKDGRRIFMRAYSDRAQLNLADGDDKPRVILWGGDTSRVSLLDTAGTSRAVFGSVDLEKTESGIVESRPVSSLVLFNKDGKVIWKAP